MLASYVTPSTGWVVFGLALALAPVATAFTLLVAHLRTEKPWVTAALITNLLVLIAIVGLAIAEALTRSDDPGEFPLPPEQPLSSWGTALPYFYAGAAALLVVGLVVKPGALAVRRQRPANGR